MSAAHRAYLDNVCAECLLPGRGGGAGVEASAALTPQNAAMRTIRSLLECALEFRARCEWVTAEEGREPVFITPSLSSARTLLLATPSAFWTGPAPAPALPRPRR